MTGGQPHHTGGRRPALTRDGTILDPQREFRPADAWEPEARLKTEQGDGTGLHAPGDTAALSASTRGVSQHPPRTRP